MSLQVFISYKSEYRDFARKVKNQIGQWGYAAWLDVDNIQPGEYFRHKIQEGLDGSEVLLMVLTEEAQLSREVMSEVDYFLDVRKKPVVPLLHQPCKPLYIFVSIQYIDFLADEANGFSRLQQRLTELAVLPEPAEATPTTLSDFLEDDKIMGTVDIANREQLKEQIRSSLGVLSDRERTVLEMRFGLTDGQDHTLEEVGKHLGVTRERVRQIEATALRKLRHPGGGHQLHGYLDSSLSPTTPADEAPDKKKREVEETQELDVLPTPSPAAEAPPREPPQPAPVTAPIAAPAPLPMPQQTAQPSLFGGIPAGAAPPPQALYDLPVAPRKRAGLPVPIWALVAVAALLVVVLGAVLLFGTQLVPPPILVTPPEQPTIMPLLLVMGVLVIGGVLVYGWRRFSVRAESKPSPETELTNRRIMLDKVEEFWIRGVLDKALEAGQFEMGLGAAPEKVLRHKDYGDYTLPAAASILDIFNDLNRELLILGAPGGGKTVLLLQLCKALIEQARTDDKKAIPVVFNLSSWAAERKPLAEWLVDELRLKYQVPKKVAQGWIEGEQLLLLLDGLDEVAEQYRNACVDAINTFRQQYREVDVAVCSRIADYDLLTSKLDVRGAVTLQPLDDDQINRYLDRPDLDGLRQVMTTDAELRDMTHKPFLLNTTAYAYAGTSVNDLQLTISDDMTKARRTHMFDRFVEKRLMANPDKQYAPRQVRKWLGWLAGYMESSLRAHTLVKNPNDEGLRDLREIIIDLYSSSNGSIFYIDGLQSYSLGKESKVTQIDHMRYSVDILENKTVLSYQYRLTILGLTVLISIIAFGAIGLLLSLLLDLAGNYVQETILYLTFGGAAFGIVPGLTIGITFSLSSKKIEIVDTVKWKISRRLVAIVVALALYVLFLANYFPGPVLFCAAGFFVVFVIAEALKPSEESSVRIKPNQGIRRSAWNAVRVGIGFTILSSIVTTIVFSAFGNPLTSFVLGCTVGLGFGVVAGLAFNGSASAIKHLAIRLILWRSGDAPLNYARFLDYCASAGLLRKVGGGYIFVHRYLLEYFAENGD